MKKISANYIFPVSGPPVKNGIIVLDEQNIIVDIINPGDEFKELPSLEFYNGILVPGFVNAHCHLELSHLKGKFERMTGLAGFVSQIKEKRSSMPSCISSSIDRALSTIKETGTVAVGDICNSADTLNPKKNSGLLFHNFIEIFGLDSSSAEYFFRNGVNLQNQFDHFFNGRTTITPHSTYSLSKELWQLLSNQFSLQEGPISIHFGESPEEYELHYNGSGKLAQFYQELGFTINLSKNITPFDVVKEFIPNSKKVLFIHNTVVPQKEIKLIKKNFLFPFCILCPSSNLFIEGILPNVPDLIHEHVNIALGTDSYASSNTLSMLDMMMIILSEFPDIPFSEVLKWATLNGARALGFDHLIGSFEVGKAPGVNLISNFDFSGMRPTGNSKVKKLV